MSDTLLGYPVVKSDDLRKVKDGDLVLGTLDDILMERTVEMDKTRCGECFFWEEREEGEKHKVGEEYFPMGVCHETSPQVVLMPGPSPLEMPGMRGVSIQVHGMFPPINSNGWCGKGRKKS